MSSDTQLKLSDRNQEQIEPYQYQLIQKRFYSLLPPAEEQAKRDAAILKIHSLLQRGTDEKSIFTLFEGRRFPLQNCLSIASGKGGVGKSMLAVNIAVYFSRVGKKVLLFDADFGLSNAHIYLDFKPKKSLVDYFISGEPEEAVEEINPSLHYVYSGSGEEKLAELRDQELSRLRNMFIALSQRYDYIIVDCSPGIGKNVLQTVAMGAESIMVTTSHVSSITDTYALIKVLRMQGIVPRTGIVVNMSHSVEEAQDSFNRISLCTRKFLNFSVDYLGNIFYSSKISQSLDKRVPVVNEHHDDMRSGRRVNVLAQRILMRMKKQDR